jgi:hypothetical protein
VANEDITLLYKFSKGLFLLCLAMWVLIGVIKAIGFLGLFAVVTAALGVATFGFFSIQDNK